MKEKKWKKALGLAILLGKPFRCFEIIKHILQQEFSQTDVDAIKKGHLDLERTLLKLRDDQISKKPSTSALQDFFAQIDPLVVDLKSR